MSSENVEIARRAIAAALSEPPDADELTAVLDPDHVLTTDWRFEGGTFHGVDGFLEAIADQDAVWQLWQQAIERVIDAGDKGVLVLLRLKALGKQSGAPVENAWAMLLEFAGAKITASRVFPDQDQGLKAVGLEE